MLESKFKHVKELYTENYKMLMEKCDSNKFLISKYITKLQKSKQQDTCIQTDQ